MMELPDCARMIIAALENPVCDPKAVNYLHYNDRNYAVRALLSFDIHGDEVERLMRKRATVVYRHDQSKLTARCSRKSMGIDFFMSKPSMLQLGCRDLKRFCTSSTCSINRDIEDIGK
jgi:hypothetical protein